MTGKIVIGIIIWLLSVCAIGAFVAACDKLSEKDEEDDYDDD